MAGSVVLARQADLSGRLGAVRVDCGALAGGVLVITKFQMHSQMVDTVIRNLVCRGKAGSEQLISILVSAAVEGSIGRNEKLCMHNVVDTHQDMYAKFHYNRRLVQKPMTTDGQLQKKTKCKTTEKVQCRKLHFHTETVTGVKGHSYTKHPTKHLLECLPNVYVALCHNWLIL